MGQTKKRQYDRYTLAYKQQAVRLTESLSVTVITPFITVVKSRGYAAASI
jgi:hypothetical protein